MATKRKVQIFDPTCCTLAQIVQAHLDAIDAMSPEDRARYVAECQQWRQDQALLALPLANERIN